MPASKLTTKHIPECNDTWQDRNGRLLANEVVAIEKKTGRTLRMISLLIKMALNKASKLTAERDNCFDNRHITMKDIPGNFYFSHEIS